MTLPRWTEVDKYIADTLLPADAALTETLELSSKAGLPAISVSPPQGKLLHLLAKAIGARRILEIGTLGGYSAIWLARALPRDGKLLTLELKPEYATIAAANFQRASVDDRIEIRIGPALASLATLRSAAEMFDLVFIDADKVTYPEYMEHAVALTRPGGLIVADNVVREGAVSDAGSSDAAVQAVRRMNDAVALDTRLSATIVQTVGVKGYDGLMVALRL